MDRRAFLGLMAASRALAQDRLDRDNLLLYRDSAAP
jgi:hypothetical protein